MLSARVDGGDRDEIPVHPFVRDDHGIERRALLLGAPGREGTAPVTVEITRGGQVVSSAAAPPLTITRDFAPAATEIAGAPSPLEAARRFAWLREQSIPRFGMSRFHVIERAMLREDLARDPRAGRNVLRLRWEARLATFEDLPRALRDTERAIVHRVVTSACSASEARIACLGRMVDTLRRFGYLGVVRDEPALADELARARANRDALPPAQRYRVLVGLVLADPADIPLQRELIALRRALTTYPPLP